MNSVQPNRNPFHFHFKVAEHSFRARSCKRNSARAQGLHKTNICSMSVLPVLFFFIIEQSIDGFPLLLLRYVREGNDVKNQQFSAF